MSFIVARWWTFQDPLPVLRQQLRLLQGASGATGEDVSVTVFDGRRHRSETASGDGDVAHALPRQYCSADVRPRAGRMGAGSTGRPVIPKYAVTINVSPTSRLWARVTKRKSANHRDHAAALSCRSLESYARVRRVREMPHLVQGYAVRKAKLTPADVARVAEILPDVLRERRGRGVAAGGVDFVSRLQQMGSYDVVGLLSPTPEAWPRLRQRFDEMHKLMFGPRAMFTALPPAEARATFESMRRVRTPAGEQVVALARTSSDMRKFEQSPEALLV